jgi:nucleoid-associated protein YgaU
MLDNGSFRAPWHSMERKKIVLLAAGVLAAGIGGALPFRHPPRDPGAAPAALADEGPVLAAALPLASADAPTPTAPAIREGTPVSNPEFPPPNAAVAENDLFSATAAPLANAAPLATASPPSAASMAAAATSPAPPNSTISSRPQSWRRHRIKDGDTLPKLAQRYLGDPAREAEIHALNRDVLFDPAILPIGVWLRIPAAE